jgi:hypothetical protein
VISCIGDLRVEATKDCIRNCDIAIRDIPTSLEPFFVEDACQEIQGSRGSENRGFREQRNLAAWNRDPRYPDGDVTSVGRRS